MKFSANLKAFMLLFFRLALTGPLVWAGQTLHAGVLEKTFDTPDGLKVSVKTIAPYAQPADLQIVCLFKHKAEGDTYIEAMKDLDDKLGGLLSSLRNRGGFIGELGETILLEPPAGTIAAKHLLLIGLGDEKNLSLDTLKVVGRVAASEAIRLQARNVSFAPTIRDQGQRDNRGRRRRRGRCRKHVTDIRHKSAVAERAPGCAFAHRFVDYRCGDEVLRGRGAESRRKHRKGIPSHRETGAEPYSTAK